ncbi:hypothetical protein LTR62_001618 [Meristemomyces frigidus]|uniref:Glutamate decarboxylase n=1 Tax=Meristemomyces frigidus TaxID=1508187 RepID=A0AAN7T960_9PEZI|nr:hypothetical protein LTR62_001618 [Meristemomyces frigidus]
MSTPLPDRPAPPSKPLQRADEAEDLLSTVQRSIISFIRAADTDANTKHTGHGLQQSGKGPRTTLLEHHPPQKLQKLLDLSLPAQGRGKQGLLQAIEQVLQYSVNTWDQGFLDKLYSSNTPVGLVADLVLGALNTNLHVYQVSPALTVIEKQTGKALAHNFGLNGRFAGGVSQPGGSAANLMSMVVARNVLFPETKAGGLGGRRFVVFTSKHGHYSAEKAAQMLGFGSEGVRSVDVDEQGRMRVECLERMISEAREMGEEPFYVNATAGTTVLGSFDPLEAIAEVCEREGLWLHVDGSWGGPVVFSESQRHRLKGVERADSVALCPHKMMNIPVTCTFLLGKDLRQFHQGMTLPAGYLFHGAVDDDGDEDRDGSAVDSSSPTAHSAQEQDDVKEVWDLADLTPQCGRRGDSLKLALAWIYYGSAGFEAQIDNAYAMAAHLADLVAKNEKFTLVSENPPPCLQVCFYFNSASEEAKTDGAGESKAKRNSRVTEQVCRRLIPRGFMVDFAPGEEGKFFRVVVNCQTRRETVDGLVKALEEVGGEVGL